MVRLFLVPLADIRITGRTTQWVILAKLKNAKDAFTSATVVDKNEGEEDEWDVGAGTVVAEAV